MHTNETPCAKKTLSMQGVIYGGAGRQNTQTLLFESKCITVLYSIILALINKGLELAQKSGLAIRRGWKEKQKHGFVNNDGAQLNKIKL